jgi:hypothetical protein
LFSLNAAIGPKFFNVDGVLGGRPRQVN